MLRSHDGFMTTDLSAGIDLADYFDRIGYAGPAEAAVETLHALVAAHNQSIPFENLDPLTGHPSRTSGPPRSPTGWSIAAAAATVMSTTVSWDTSWRRRDLEARVTEVLDT